MNKKEDYQIFGIRAILEAIDAGKSIDKVFVQKGLKGALMMELLSVLKQRNITIAYVPVEKLNRLTKKNHQGAVAKISPITFVDFETLVNELVEKKENPLFLVLDKLSDVRNFGAILRTAECTGVDAVIIQKQGAAPVTEDTIKTSAGAAFKIPITKVDHIKDAIYYLQASGVKVAAATEKTDQVIFNTELKDAMAVVMGAEDVGVSPAVLKMVDLKLKLPMLGTISSLNVSVACGVVLYEIVRQRELF